MYLKKKKKGKKKHIKDTQTLLFFERFREVLGHSKRQKEFGNLINRLCILYLFISLKVLKFDLGGLSLAMNFFQ